MVRYKRNVRECSYAVGSSRKNLFFRERGAQRGRDPTARNKHPHHSHYTGYYWPISVESVNRFYEEVERD